MIMHEYKIQSLDSSSYIFLHIFLSTQSRKLNQAEVCFRKIALNTVKITLTRPIGLPPHTPVAHKIADQR